MLRSIYQRIWDALRTNSRRKAPRQAPRRLAVESLESRRLMTVTTLTSNSISDGSFEAPALAAAAFQIAPASSPWQFSGDAGASSNASGFTVGNSNAPDGNQVAFLKNNASISQTVSLDAGVYNLSFVAAQRVNYQTQNQEIEVLIDNTDVGLIVPASTTYSAYQTSNFTVTAGTHTVELLGMSPANSDSTAFIDEVAIAPVVDTVLDGGFEQPALATNTLVTDPSGLPWQFSGTAGVASNGNSTEAQNAPAGTQVGFLQETGSMSQTVYLDAGTYQLSFLAAQGTANLTNYEEIEVLVDGAQYGTIEPVNTTYATCQSSTFAVAAGAHTIELLGADPLGGDSTAFIDQVSIAPANAISDGSFETPALDTGTYQFAPTGSSWQFSGGAGVASNASAFTSGNPNAPDGTQVAILEGDGSMSQSVDLLAGSYNISFQAAQCATNAQTQGQQIQVLVDDKQVGLITPLGTSYGLYETTNFTVTGGTHTIQFTSTNPQGGENTALIDLVSLTASQDQITDGGFESPVLAANAYQVAPSGTPWQFSGLAGVSASGSAMTTGGPAAPQGAQVGFIMNNASMSYSVDLDADTYNLSFLAAQRAKYQTQNQQIQVLVDGTQVGLITPSSTTYTLYETANFTVTAGVHNIQFVGMSPQSADSTALIDQVSITAAENSFSDGGFEAPVLAKDSYAPAPSGSGWQFAGDAGISANDSGFTSVTKGALNAPDGTQVAFIKNNGSISQSVYFDAGTYNISFLATQRINYQTQNQQIEVLVGGVQVALITPATSTTPNSSSSNPTYTYTAYQTSNFTVTAGAHTVEFLGMSPPSGDSTAFVDDTAINAGCAISDGSFEQTVLAAKAYQFTPSGTPWQFSGAAGVSANNSGFTAGNPNAPDGNQVAFVKDTGSMSQSVDLAAGFYNLSFMAAQRDKYQSQYESLEILVDGKQVGTATPSSTTYGLYQTSNFTVTAGVHTIQFVGVNPEGGDNTVFIDQVQLNG
jgi:hypothetical protein